LKNSIPRYVDFGKKKAIVIEISTKEKEFPLIVTNSLRNTKFLYFLNINGTIPDPENFDLKKVGGEIKFDINEIRGVIWPAGWSPELGDIKLPDYIYLLVIAKSRIQSFFCVSFARKIFSQFFP
jgi:hypothetical protein